MKHRWITTQQVTWWKKKRKFECNEMETSIVCTLFQYLLFCLHAPAVVAIIAKAFGAVFESVMQSREEKKLKPPTSQLECWRNHTSTFVFTFYFANLNVLWLRKNIEEEINHRDAIKLLCDHEHAMVHRLAYLKIKMSPCQMEKLTAAFIYQVICNIRGILDMFNIHFVLRA